MKKLIICLCLITTGCASVIEAFEKERERNRANYQAKLQSTCDGYGFQRGTTDYSRCMMQVDQQTRAAKAANDAAEMNMYMGMMKAGAPQPAPSPVINCQSRQQGVYVNTTCQ